MSTSLYSLTIAAASLVGFASCSSPTPAPPTRYRPDPPFTPESLTPAGAQNDVAPPTLSPPTSSDPPMIDGYPTAGRTANIDQVLSPFEPFNVIDVSGFKSGQLVRDPSNKKIFRIP